MRSPPSSEGRSRAARRTWTAPGGRTLPRKRPPSCPSQSRRSAQSGQRGSGRRPPRSACLPRGGYSRSIRGPIPGRTRRLILVILQWWRFTTPSLCLRLPAACRSTAPPESPSGPRPTEKLRSAMRACEDDPEGGGVRRHVSRGRTKILGGGRSGLGGAGYPATDVGLQRRTLGAQVRRQASVRESFERAVDLEAPLRQEIARAILGEARRFQDPSPLRRSQRSASPLPRLPRIRPGSVG